MSNVLCYYTVDSMCLSLECVHLAWDHCRRIEKLFIPLKKLNLVFKFPNCVALFLNHWTSLFGFFIIFFLFFTFKGKHFFQMWLLKWVNCIGFWDCKFWDYRSLGLQLIKKHNVSLGRETNVDFDTLLRNQATAFWLLYSVVKGFILWRFCFRK